MISGTYLKSEVVDVVNDSVILADTVHVELCPLIVNPLDTAMAISSRPASYLYGLEPGAKMHNPGTIRLYLVRLSLLLCSLYLISKVYTAF